MIAAKTPSMGMVGQGLDYAAIGDPAPFAPGEHALKLGLQSSKSRDASIDVGKMGVGNPVGPLAWSLRIVR